MAELHVIGELLSGHDFGGGSFFCAFEFITGTQWTAAEGHTAGATYIMREGGAGIAWNFPIDVHYSFNSVQGWPRLAIQVWKLDDYGRRDLAGYGTAFLPMPGKDGQQRQKLTISTWKPVPWNANPLVRLWQNLRLVIMGGNPVLRDNSLITDNEQRFKLHTITGGTVEVSVTVLGRGLQQAGFIYA